MDENKILREELAEMRVLCNEVLVAGSVTFDERRVNLLKAQVYQLERQVLVLSECLGARTSALCELEDALVSVSNTCREYIGAEVHGPEVPVKRCHLTGMVEMLELCRVKLSKAAQNEVHQNLHRPLMLPNDYIKDHGQTTMFDICSGELQHLNLKKVAQLESRLCKLYSNLDALQESMQLYRNKDTQRANSLLLDRHLQLDPHADHFHTRIQLSCALLKDCCEELLPLSLLYPAAPWSELRKVVLSGVTTEHVVSVLPSLPRIKHNVVVRVLEDLMKVTNHRLYIHNKQIENLRGELKFHQSVYTLQQEYTESLFTAVSEGYSQFEANLSKVIHTPLKELVEAFDSLQESASEEDMRRLLETFQKHRGQLQTIVDDLETASDLNAGTTHLSHFAAQFQQTLNKLCSKCKKAKNREATSLEVLVDDQAHLESQLRDILAECEAKKESAETKLDKLKIECSRDSSMSDRFSGPNMDHKTGSVFEREKKAKPARRDGVGYCSNRTQNLRKDNNAVGRQSKTVTGRIGRDSEVDTDRSKITQSTYKFGEWDSSCDVDKGRDDPKSMMGVTGKFGEWDSSRDVDKGKDDSESRMGVTGKIGERDRSCASVDEVSGEVTMNESSVKRGVNHRGSGARNTTRVPFR